MGSTLGTLTWAERTGGLLRMRDRLRLAGQFAVQTPALPGEALGRFGRTPPPADLVPPARPPISSIGTAAIELCRKATADRPWLFGHSVRSFAFGQLFAQRERIDFDPEVLWIAALLHDFALADGAGPVTSGPECFAARSAIEARRLAAEAQWPADRQRQLADAISLHINVRVPSKRSAEGHLLNLGSALDVAGIGYRRVYSAAMLDVLKRYPPGDFRDVIADVWNAEARRSPGCRAAFLRSTGFGALIKTSPMARRAGLDIAPPGGISPR